MGATALFACPSLIAEDGSLTYLLTYLLAYLGATALFACPSLITEAGYATRSGASIRAIVLGGEAVCSTWLLAALGLVGLLMVVSK